MTTEEFKHKYMPCQAKMYAVALRLTGSKDDARDVVQDAFVRLWARKKMLNEVLNVEAYSVRIVKNLCFDLLRSKKSRKNEPIEDFKLTSEGGGQKNVELKSSVEYLGTLLGQLSEQQQLVFKLRHYDDLSLEEIEDVTGFSAVNIRVLLSRGRKKLRELMTNEQMQVLRNM